MKQVTTVLQPPVDYSQPLSELLLEASFYLAPYILCGGGLCSRDKRNVLQATVFSLQERDTFVGWGNFYFSFLLYFP